MEENKRVTQSPDFKGRPRVWNRQTYLTDPKYAPRHERFIVLRAHSFRLTNKKVAASGLLDPKAILVGDTIYVELAQENPRCELCEGGEMIPLEERFYGSPYKPITPPQSPPQKILGKLRMTWNRWMDLYDQRGF